ncbi:MAG: ATP-dependent DNA helicase RecG [Proteobacteria bacterium]|jgi:ATP-dependent DNA helicase RecG|nr:ATP-dependent DNA helicase RecG [Alphaproteobacteria bacterium]NCC02589.1 ATP-dependent DNA helicase RecG [Pseudomonadota bacterium]
MRPTLLFSLFTPLTSLKGVGDKVARNLARLDLHKAVDLLWHLPSGEIDRSYQPKLRTAQTGKIATLTVDVVEHVAPARPGKPYRIIATDSSGDITINYFTQRGDYLANLYPVGKPIVISGELQRFGRGWTMSHPDYALPPDRANEIPPLEPVYPLTEGITSKKLSGLVRQVLPTLPDMPEWHNADLLAHEKWPSWRDALKTLHLPQGTGKEQALQRLIYDELLADQLALAIIRRHHRNGRGRVLKGDGKLRRKLQDTLPFQLTEGQKVSVDEILADMASESKMLRLLQGDVGSGKTIVAVMAMLAAVESGAQAAFMAPTEILARQHYERLTSFLTPLGLEIGLLLGKGRGKERDETLRRIADGSLRLVVGTHALFQQDVAFHDLGLAIIDEQHRFGVQQRLQLSQKGQGVDILVMTATPIPRTLTLTAYGDMDVSRLMEKPAGRQPIDTRLFDMNRMDEIISAVRRILKSGAQIYWVCPLVEESEKSDLAAATQRAEMLSKIFPVEQVGLVHGRLASEQKKLVMDHFQKGDIKILVATTVIEVGVDVPNASVMIIEHGERFGLSQLHQLRGRIGRGSAKSNCLILYQPPLNDTAKERLSMMRETEDGFRLAEEDLRLRGPGDILGTRQSGLPVYRMANLLRDRKLLAMANTDSKHILATDPDLATDRGKALRILLYLFEKDNAVRLFRSG